jgi:putative ABC transport system substrate-binding protein
VEGQNIAIEPRWAEGKYDRLPALAADLVRLKVDVIVAQSGAATKAAQQATRTTPIVMSVVIDPLGSGLVSSLARPGGNVTRLSNMSSDLIGKQFDVLNQALPEVSRVALLWNPKILGAHPSCERRRLQLGPWGCDITHLRRGVLRRSTPPSRR